MIKPPDYSYLPEHERPLNIGAGKELIDIEMSNFEQAPFELDGRLFQSVEGFYYWLKFAGDPQKQAQVQKLYSYEAKKFGKSSKATTTEYDGRTIVLGSTEHHALIKRASQAKLEQHPDLARRFAETYPRPIIHDFGYLWRPPGRPPGEFPNEVFARILTELRQDLIDGRIVTIAGTVSELSAQAAQAEAAKKKYPITDVLWTLKDLPELKNHPVQKYAELLEDSDIKVVRFLTAGAHQMVFEVPNNQVIKLTTKIFGPNFSRRQFHLHILEPRVIDSGDGFLIQYYKQPMGSTPVTPEQLHDFETEIDRQGYVLVDGAQEQLSIYNGGVKLHAPLAVQKKI